MNERNLKDLINCDSTDKEKMMEAAKEKLRWYTFEASEEDFNVEAVDALVRFLRDVEPELGVISEDEKDKSVHVQKRRVIEWNRGKIAAAVVIGVLTLTLASIIVGNSLGTSLAWEDGGFFKLRRDKEGDTMLTFPTDLNMADGNILYFDNITEVPEEYRRYTVEPEKIFAKENVNILSIAVDETVALKKVSETFGREDQVEIKCGVMIYEKNINVIRDSFDGFKYQYTNLKDGINQTVFMKDNVNGDKEYLIYIFDANKKYFVSGQCDLEEIEELALKYYSIISK